MMRTVVLSSKSRKGNVSKSDCKEIVRCFKRNNVMNTLYVERNLIGNSLIFYFTLEKNNVKCDPTEFFPICTLPEYFSTQTLEESTMELMTMIHEKVFALFTTTNINKFSITDFHIGEKVRYSFYVGKLVSKSNSEVSIQDVRGEYMTISVGKFLKYGSKYIQ